jgi:sporulation protein YpjB
MFPKKQIKQNVVISVFILIALFFSACSSNYVVKNEPITKPNVSESQKNTIKDLNKIADLAYQDLKNSDWVMMRSKVTQLAILATKLSYEGLTTVEGVQAINQSIAETMYSLNAVTPNPMKISQTMVRTRLVLDALEFNNEPMWIDFYEPMKKDLHNVVLSVEKNHTENTNNALASWKSRVSMVKSAIIISNGISDTIKLESISTFIENATKTKNVNVLKQTEPDFQNILKDIFKKNPNRDHETIAPVAPQPPDALLWSFIIGMLIILVLSWVAWRKYHAEFGIVRVKNERDFDKGI